MSRKKRKNAAHRAAAEQRAAAEFYRYQGDFGSQIPLYAWDFDLLIKALEAIPFTDILSDQHINTPNGFVRRDHLVRWLKEWKRYFASPCHEQVMADLRMRVWKEKVNYDE